MGRASVESASIDDTIRKAACIGLADTLRDNLNAAAIRSQHA